MPSRAEPSEDRTGHRIPRGLGLGAAVLLLAATALLSLAVGSNPLPLGEVVDALRSATAPAATVIRGHRLPRTAMGVVVGGALGLGGALMQSLTRNPLADPGLLGVSAGASAGIVVAIGFLGIEGLSAYVWFAFAGAAAAATVVYLLGTSGRGAASPVRLALAGTAISAALISATQAVVLGNPRAFDQFRFWSVGSLEGRSTTILLQVLPFLAVGALVAFTLGPALNALALGEDAGRALGARPARTRVLGALAVTLLCGGATAAVGPIAFVGLTVPHVARSITGPDQRWVLPYSFVLGAILLLGTDVVGRVLIRPQELEVGIVSAILGAPVFIALVRRKRIAHL